MSLVFAKFSCSEATPHDVAARLEAPTWEHGMTKIRKDVNRSFRGKVISLTAVAPVVFFVHGVASAAWTQIDPASGATDQRRYVDLDTVRQAGPMAIYRQVSELIVYATRLESGAMSILRTSEYDCMSAKVRVLTETGFRSPWADGETASIPDGQRRQGGWSALKEDPAGEAVRNSLCPGGTQP
jgi:hypothetical protein